jgi:hypothetical protein
LRIVVPIKRILNDDTISPQNPFKTLKRPLKTTGSKSKKHPRNNLHLKSFKIVKKFREIKNRHGCRCSRIEERLCQKIDLINRDAGRTARLARRIEEKMCQKVHLN